MYSNDDDKMKIIGIFAGLAIIALIIGIYWYARNSTYTVNMTVDSLNWQRVQPVEMYKVLNMDTDIGSMPGDAYNINRYTYWYYQSETCYRTHTTYDSKGKSHTSTESYECGHMVSEAKARYNINRWVWDHDMVTSGTVHEDRVWPDFVPVGTGEIGSTRAGQRRETLTVTFKCTEHNPLTYTATDDKDWLQYVEGVDYSVQVNRLEQVYWDTIKKESSKF